MLRILSLSMLLAVNARSVHGQATTPASPPPPPPATKIEAFKPAAGSIVTFGFNELGKISGVSVDARELRDSKGAVVRGVVVEVTQSQYREERAFIDADEIPELVKGIDAILAVNANPTTYQNFEVRYETKGALQITAFSSSRSGGISYAVQAGRTLRAQVFADQTAIQKLKAMFEAAIPLLSSPPAK